MECSTSFGWDDNLLNASDNELDAFDTKDPNVFFAVDRMEDAFFQGEIQADWKLGKPLGIKTKFRAEYRRIQYLNATIKSEDTYGGELFFKPLRKTRLALQFEHKPQVYGRHRRDKDGDPGEPMFRAEVHKRWSLGLEIEQMIAQQWKAIAEVEGALRNYTKVFNERDRSRVEAAVGVEWLPDSWFELGLMGGFRLSKSRNEPDLGKDLSYRELLLEPTILLKERKWIPRLDVSFQFKWREYTSENPEDKRHYNRSDLYYNIQAKVTRSLTKRFAVNAMVKYSWKDAEFDPIFDFDFEDEEGTSSDLVAMGGITWKWDAK